MITFEFRDANDQATRHVEVRRVIVAGFTGRDEAAVRAHIDELVELGVPAPSSTPTFYDLPAEALTLESPITVAGSFTSGEVEPVIVVSDGEYLLGVGSDHTDRDLERDSIDAAKRACPKLMSAEVVPMASVSDWDSLRLTSWVGPDDQPYQQGHAGELLPVAELIDRMRAAGRELRDGDVLFLGTVPVTGGGLRASERFRARLHEPASDVDLHLEYEIESGAPDGQA